MTSDRSRRSRRRGRSAASSRHPGDESELPKRRFKPILWSVLGIVLVVGLIAVAWFSPLLSVRTISVEGLGVLPEEQIVTALAIPEGRPLLRVDTDAAAKRVAQIPRVAQVRVQKVYPSTVKVTVTERLAAVFFDSPQGTHLMDSLGVDYAIEPPLIGVPRLKVANPSASDPATLAALAVLASTPPPLRAQLGEVAAASISDIRLTLLDGRVIVWGSKDKSDRKAAITLPLLSQPGRLYDVSSPDLPTVR